MIFIPDEKIEWVPTPITKDDWRIHDSPYHYEFILPRPLADWDVFDYWERERFDHMRDNLQHGEVLFDIGTEQGWCNLIYADFVGPENMVLIEPTFEFWANIKKTWDKNYDVPPLACYWGLFDKSTRDDFDKGFDIWGKAEAEQIIDRNKYQYIHESSSDITHIQLDKYVDETGIVPDALTMDVEGAEFLILMGAKYTLQKYHPKLWISIHPDLGERDYNTKKEDVIGLLEAMGYVGEHLATDHEEHWYFKYEA